MGKVVVMDHPLIQHKIGIMRRTDTGSKDFRTLRKQRGICGRSDARNRRFSGGST